MVSGLSSINHRLYWTHLVAIKKAYARHIKAGETKAIVDCRLGGLGGLQGRCGDVIGAIAILIPHFNVMAIREE